MNTDTGELKRMSELIEEFGTEEEVREAGFEPVPDDLAPAAESLLDWSQKRQKERNRNRNRAARESRRRNRR